ncbi:MAG TPA: glucoamylase family protein [Fimbriimonas sp.]|nr:glucoamylase family protein [Fimbriimonas sp.]
MIAALTLASVLVAQGNLQLDDIQHRAVRFFWEQSNPETGISKDRADNHKPVDDHTIGSCASVGFALPAYIIGVERHWLPRKDALERTKVTLRHLNTLWPNEHGWLYHFVDWKTGARQWNCEASSIDTSICLAGVIQAKEYWKDSEVTTEADKFAKRIDWKWMLTDGGNKPDETTLSMGWKPEDGFIDARWSSFCELNMIYIQAYGIDPTIRTDGWGKIARGVFTDRGHTYLVGGPLFMHEMSNSFYDFSEMRDPQGFNYWVDTKESALQHRAYAIDNPNHHKGYDKDFWGLSACDTPKGYMALGAWPDFHDNGTITPTSALAAMPYTPAESKSMLAHLLKDYGQYYGKYGFPNGMCPDENWYDSDVIGIDLGMMLLGVEDYRTGLPWKLSMRSPWIKRGYQRIGFHKAPGSNGGPLQVKE